MRHLDLVCLAWRDLSHDKRRLAVSLIGICFTVVLICLELGFWNALFDGAVEVIRQLDADLIVTSKSRVALIANQQFPRRRLAQALAVSGVQSACPLYVEYYLSEWKNPDADPPFRPIRVLAFDPTHSVFRLVAVREQQERLRQPDTVLVDELSRPEFGLRSRQTGWELAGRSVQVVGRFRLGTDFAIEGNALMSDVSFARYFPRRNARAGGVANPLAEVDLGLIKLAAGADRDQVLAELRSTLPDDLALFTVEGFVRQEIDFWGKISPIGFVFGLGVLMGFIIGAVICYLILSSGVEDHQAEYATLKAIGYRNRHLRLVVLEEALLLSVLGSLPGVGLGGLLYKVLAGWTGLPLRLSLDRVACLLGLTVLMCLLSGLLALRKLEVADPAEVFDVRG
jgi:putative ABC transport system permease protein